MAEDILVVIIPTRSRPQAAAELLEVFDQTCTADVRLVFAIDRDDPMWSDYAKIVRGVPGRYVRQCGPPSNMVAALNDAALWATGWDERPFAIGFLGDDHRPRTKGWDQSYLDALRELGTGIVYGNDLLQGPNLPTQCAMTSDIIRTLGYMAPPGLTHLYVDNSWLALGKELGRIRYLPDVVVEHMHPVANKAEWDAGYARVNTPAMYQRDRAAFQAWLRGGLPVEAARLRRVAT